MYWHPQKATKETNLNEEGYEREQVRRIEEYGNQRGHFGITDSRILTKCERQECAPESQISIRVEWYSAWSLRISDFRLLPIPKIVSPKGKEG